MAKSIPANPARQDMARARAGEPLDLAETRGPSQCRRARTRQAKPPAPKLSRKRELVGGFWVVSDDTL
jgi:hypothetical protein